MAFGDITKRCVDTFDSSYPLEKFDI